jgi:hypothetical protein
MIIASKLLNEEKGFKEKYMKNKFLVTCLVSSLTTSIFANDIKLTGEFSELYGNPFMKIINENSSVWYERYKPQCIEDLILPESLKQQLQTSINPKYS